MIHRITENIHDLQKCPVGACETDEDYVKEGSKGTPSDTNGGDWIIPSLCGLLTVQP